MPRGEAPLRLAASAALLEIVVSQDPDQRDDAQHRETDVQLGQAASSSRMRSASSMSTATTRDTPDSGMVTPISCSAISMAILLWLCLLYTSPSPRDS